MVKCEGVRIKTTRWLCKAAASQLVCLILLLSASFGYAQERVTLKAHGSMGPGNLYDLTTIQRIRGEVLTVEEFSPALGMPPGVVLSMKTEEQAIARVFLGPQWYLESRDFEVEAKDRLEVKGSKITYEGKPALVAAVVLRGDQVIRLRDENGVPVWSVWAPKRQAAN